MKSKATNEAVTFTIPLSHISGIDLAGIGHLFIVRPGADCRRVVQAYNKAIDELVKNAKRKGKRTVSR